MKKGGEEERRESARDHIELFVRCAFGFEKEIRPSLSLFSFSSSKGGFVLSLSLLPARRRASYAHAASEAKEGEEGGGEEGEESRRRRRFERRVIEEKRGSLDSLSISSLVFRLLSSSLVFSRLSSLVSPRRIKQTIVADSVTFSFLLLFFLASFYFSIGHGEERYAALGGVRLKPSRFVSSPSSCVSRDEYALAGEKNSFIQIKKNKTKKYQRVKTRIYASTEHTRERERKDE